MICYLTVLLSAYVSYLFCGNVDFLWYCLFHSWKRLKFGMLLVIVLLIGDVAVFFGVRGGHNSYTTATDFVFTNSFFLFCTFLMLTYLIYAVMFAVKLFIFIVCFDFSSVV